MRFASADHDTAAAAPAVWPEFKPPFVGASSRSLADTLVLLEEHVPARADRSYALLTESGSALLRFRVPQTSRVVGCSRRWLYVAEPNAEDLVRVVRYPVQALLLRRASGR